ncbi:hypothetical protein SEA_GUEY18_139 [Gordonia phage Guey18]|nr:hypothetical protein SEA_GUEY18_139 [Gordonia phage Guey18]
MIIDACVKCSHPMGYDEGISITEWDSVTQRDFCSRKCLVEYISENGWLK